MSDTAGGTLHGRDPKQSEGNTSLNKETPTHLERQSGAVTAAGAAFILLTLLALRPFTYINPALPLETHFKLIPSYGVNLASFLIFAFAAVATILRWKRWRIWAGAAAWLAMFLAFRSFESIALTTRFLSQGARINPEQLIVSLLMLAISVFVLWMWNQERKTAATNIKSEVTVGGIALVFLGIYIFFPTLGLLLSSNPAGLFFSVISLIFVFAGLAMVLRWRALEDMGRHGIVADDCDNSHRACSRGFDARHIWIHRFVEIDLLYIPDSRMCFRFVGKAPRQDACPANCKVGLDAPPTSARRSSRSYPHWVVCCSA